MVAQERPAGRRLHIQALVWVGSVLAVMVSVTVVLASYVHTPSQEMTPQQRTILLKLESVLMHDTDQPQYFRVSLQSDERGYVAGIGDFATADGSALEVIEVYTARVGTTVLSRDYAATLNRIATTGVPDATDLESTDLRGYPDAWQQASRDPVFQQAQDSVLHTAYLTPAIAMARQAGVHSLLGIAIFFDSLLQHGDSASPDALPALIARTNAQTDGPATGTAAERDWLITFLDIREQALSAPTDPAHQLMWPHLVGRVHALADLIDADAWQLTAPVIVNPYGTVHRIDASPPQIAAPPTGPYPSVSTTRPQPSSVPTSATGPTLPGGTAQHPRLAGEIAGIAGLCLDLVSGRTTPGNEIKDLAMQRRRGPAMDCRHGWHAQDQIHVRRAAQRGRDARNTRGDPVV